MLFRDVEINQTFRWRGAKWLKVGQNHATEADNPEHREHVPSHDTVEVVPVVVSTTAPDAVTHTPRTKTVVKPESAKPTGESEDSQSQ